MAIRTRVRRRRRRYTVLPLLALAVVGGWWALAWLEPGTETAEALLPATPQIASTRQEIPEALPPQTNITEKGSNLPAAERPGTPPKDSGPANTETSSGGSAEGADGSTAERSPASSPISTTTDSAAGTTENTPNGLADTSSRPKPADSATPSRPAADGTARGPDRPVENAAGDSDRARALVAAGKQALGKGDLIAARTHFSDALQLDPDAKETATLRADLTRLGQETVLSPKIIDGDPHIGRYIVKTGDSLAKIAALHKVPVDLLAEINGITDKNLIRAGQTLKVIKGPFHAFVDKSDFTLDVYLDRTFVRHFRVGLGSDNSTPTGLWQVDTKLVNPTYYPPRGGQIIAADDPANPLGERWIALKGIDGEALGQERYGIHGTNEPNSIGRSVSLGCVRMYNQDVEALYNYLIEKHSTVTIVE